MVIGAGGRMGRKGRKLESLGRWKPIQYCKVKKNNNKKNFKKGNTQKNKIGNEQTPTV